MLFCSIDTEVPRKYGKLRAEMGLVGLPSIAFLDAEGEVLVKVSVDERSAAGFRRMLARAEDYVEQRAAAAAGDGTAAARFLLMQLEERQLTLESGTARRRALGDGVDQALRAAIDQRLVDLEVATMVRKAGQAGRHALGPRFLAMLKDGPRPSAHVTRGFWFAILEWAERQRDVKAFAAALDGMRAALQVTDPGKPWVDTLLRRYHDKLRELER